MARKQTSEKPVVLSTGSGAAPARRKPVAKRPRAIAVEIPIETEAAVAGPVEIEQPANSIVLSVTLPTVNQVSALAYSYWETRGRQGGSPEEDWIRAEKELCVRMAS
jgi:hypothetical protein